MNEIHLGRKLIKAKSCKLFQLHDVQKLADSLNTTGTRQELYQLITRQGNFMKELDDAAEADLTYHLIDTV